MCADCRKKTARMGLKEHDNRSVGKADWAVVDNNEGRICCGLFTIMDDSWTPTTCGR